MNPVRRVALTAVLFSVPAVAHAEVQPLRTPESDPQTIVGGDAVPEGEFTEVVALELSGSTCTGVLVAPTLILTAAHCVVNLPPDAFIAVHTGTAREGMPEALGLEFGAFPDYIPDPTASDTLDYGYIVIDRALGGPYATPITDQAEWDAAMRWDALVTIVGYGNVDPDPMVTSDGTKRELTVPIDGFSPRGLEFRAGGDGKDSCTGDSGGPVFVELPDGQRRLAGVTSRGSMVCGTGGIYAVSHVPLCWMRDASGIDVTGRCSTCDCIDTTPPPKPEDGCGCVASDVPSDTHWLWLALFGALGWRRRSDRAAVRRESLRVA